MHETIAPEETELFQDQFLTLDELISPKSDLMKKAKKRSFDDVMEMMRNNQWENIFALYHPMDEKAPDMVISGMDLPIREKVAFVPGQMSRFDEAIVELQICVKKEPENFYTHSSLEYISCNSLIASYEKMMNQGSPSYRSVMRSQACHFADYLFDLEKDYKPSSV